MEETRAQIQRFIVELINNNYEISTKDKLFMKVTYDSRVKHPDICKIKDYYFKTTYLSRILSLQMEKAGFRVPMITIKERAKQHDIVVYYKRMFDKTTNKLANFFFIIDTLTFVTFGFKKYHGKHFTGQLTEDETFTTYALKKQNGKYVEVDENFNTEHIHLMMLLKSGKKADLIEEMSAYAFDEITEQDVYFTFIALENIRICSEINLILDKNGETEYSIPVKIISVSKVSFDDVYEYKAKYVFNNNEKKNLASILTYIESIR